MRATRVVSLATVGRMARKAAGLALVLAALVSVASAQTLTSTKDVPEIDAGMMTSALTLLSGGLLLITGRSRRNK